MMNILGCLDVPTTGSYFLDGQDVSHFSDDELSIIRNEKIGFIFQGFHLIPGLSALENVELPLLYRSVPRHERKAAALEALTRMGLASRLHHRPNQMVRGQQQRVAIARAIVGKPPIILADEPHRKPGSENWCGSDEAAQRAPSGGKNHCAHHSRPKGSRLCSADHRNLRWTSGARTGIIDPKRLIIE